MATKEEERRKRVEAGEGSPADIQLEEQRKIREISAAETESQRQQLRQAVAERDLRKTAMEIQPELRTPEEMEAARPGFTARKEAQTKREIEQREETTALIDPSVQLNEAERLLRSGLIIPATFMNFGEMVKAKLTGKPARRLVTADELATGDYPLARFTGTVLGMGLKVMHNIPQVGPALNNALFGDYSKTVTNLQNDAADLESSSRILLTAVRDGSDPDSIIRRMELLERAFRQRYADAMKIVEENPESIRQGLDLTDSLIAGLTTVQERRFIIERYKLSGDPTEILRVTDTFI